MSARIPLSEAAKSDLQARIDKALFLHRAALAKGDEVTAQQHWNDHISLLEVQMGRVERPGELTEEVR